MTNTKKELIDRLCTPFSKVSTADPKKFLIVDDIGREVSTVSDRYELVNNGDLIRPLAERFGYDSITQAFRRGKGEFHFKINTGREFDLGDGDIIKEQIVIGNSVNKSRSFSFLFGAFRMVCSNGMYSGRAVINFRKVHIGNIPVGDIVKGVLDNYQSNQFETWYRLRNAKLTVDQSVELVNGLEVYEARPEDKEIIKGDAVGYWMPKNNAVLNALIRNHAKYLIGKPESLDNQRNAWGVYNQVNRAIAQVVPTRDINKQVLGNTSAEEYLLSALSLN